jgi:ATP-dependent Clp protease adaptor protein ClpS
MLSAEGLFDLRAGRAGVDGHGRGVPLLAGRQHARPARSTARFVRVAAAGARARSCRYSGRYEHACDRPPPAPPARASGDDKKPSRPAPTPGTGVALEERTRTKKPPMYKVLLHNDDYTTKEFVVFVLQTVFQRSEGDAVAIMNHVHAQGVGVAGVYTFEIAETKVQKTVQLARANEYPLQLSIEPSE